LESKNHSLKQKSTLYLKEAKQKQAHIMSNIYEEVEIEDMEFDEQEQMYYYPCPCGDKFRIGLEELWDGEDIAKCPSCSLRIMVIFDPADLPPFIDDDEEDDDEANDEKAIKKSEPEKKEKKETPNDKDTEKLTDKLQSIRIESS
jgi:diphthamide biosynthesis protein 3